MKNLTSILIVFLIATASIFGQKTIKRDGDIVTENRNVGTFNQISVSGHFDVELIKGKEGTITLSGEKNILENIETEVKDGNLKVKFKNGFSFRSYKKISITIGFQSINSASLSGSGKIISKDIMNESQLDIALSGSGSLKFKADVTNLSSKISGSGNIQLSGSSDNFSGTISGSGNINAEDLKSIVANVQISGSGNVKLYVENEIHAKTSGSGNIIYYGNPTIIKAKSSGSGSVKKRN